ncbi:MAG: hypothetical protein A3J66_04200 [Candidatus Magasanikbacteria bacterium RIFCSPHIGHO2_02_FULL_47_14]|uniref:Uncharacterized protein n=1 Tax=Candidatus Magasanikbacteria bacterium RIFCSPHIGHO2_02_FULL_47_14 TaxID=1798680 RepID=A0A1F6M3N5_9BACT|nr:MAG: hypothetical protein A3J66_04200 [Candidatus Magasanikbacteria bacterium RIFCSPHIGHO2_02_FULL_47_14]
MSQTTNAPQTGLSSSSVVSLLAVNLFTIILAVWQHWSMASVMWTYWFQSVVIGVFQYKKILDLKEFSTEGFTSNGRRVEENEKGKKMTARFFVIHYGFFHFVYMVFLFPLVLRVEWLSVIPGAIAFFLNHRRSYELHQGEPRRNTPNIGSMMFFPYARIFPMHFILIMGAVFASKSQLILIIFLLLKTGADLLMHVVEHRQKSQV